jgi:hypothetical protein
MLTDAQRLNVFTKFQERFHTAENPCRTCPGRELEELFPEEFSYKRDSSDYCIQLCGTIWPELMGEPKSDGWAFVMCPCHKWEHDEAERKLNKYLNEEDIREKK